MSKIVGRTLDFFEVFAREQRPLSLSEISRLLSLPASSCHDVLAALQARGYLYEVSPRGGYYPTRRLDDLARGLVDRDPMLLRAKALLGNLRDRLDETIMLTKARGLEAIYLLVLEPTQPLRFRAKVGDHICHLHATSTGKALLGSLDEPGLNAYLSTAKLEQLTPTTLTSAALVRAEIAEGNLRGWFLNNGQSLDGLTGLSSRFTWNGGTYIVSVAGPTARVEPRLGEIPRLLVEACRALEMRTGPD